jgi:hypothetical protein
VNTGSTCKFGQLVRHCGCNKAFTGIIFPVAALLACLVLFELVSAQELL